MILTDKENCYLDAHQKEAFDLLIELAQIPSPSNHEEKRAEFCRNWLEAHGAEGVYIDEALNVIYPIGCTEDNPIAVFMAHSDVVFPDTEPLPLEIKDGKIFCPGIGDDSANVAALMTAATYIAKNKLQPAGTGILIVINSGEEGLGNLKGCRKIMEKFGNRVTEFVTFDLSYERIADRAVGSKRFRVQIETEGGHSFGAFGNRNAIAYLASLINSLYNIKVPPKGKTTYNVGTISGGTSVNTIAQQAEMLYEIRSDERESLEIMEKHFNAAIDFYRTKGVKVTVDAIGDRPCSGEIDENKENALRNRGAAAVKNNTGVEPSFDSASTDCNIPLSMGIPSICVGCAVCQGVHTRGEWVEIDSLAKGLGVALEMILYHF